MRNIVVLSLCLLLTNAGAQRMMPGYVACNHIFSTNLAAWAVLNPNITYERYLGDSLMLEFTTGIQRKVEDVLGINNGKHELIGAVSTPQAIFNNNALYVRAGVKRFLMSTLYVSLMAQYRFRFNLDLNTYVGTVNSDTFFINNYSTHSHMFDLLGQAGHLMYHEKTVSEIFIGCGLGYRHYRNVKHPFESVYEHSGMRICVVAGYRIGLFYKYLRKPDDPVE